MNENKYADENRGKTTMNTLEELTYYCREPEPVGALLLTGEWGCGKTYLIEHDLKVALKDEAVVLRVSLFGVSSIEEIHVAVKQAWMSEYYKSKGIEKFAEKAQKGKDVVANLEFLPDWLKGIATINMTSFVEIKEKINNKPVILVFDDLERCRIDNVDVLGSINEYCENKKFHTIIVANQDKLQTAQEYTQINAEIEINNTEGSNSVSEKKQAILKVNLPSKPEPGAISYTEIKEKIIQRTVQYIPDYMAIVHTVIDTIKYEEDEYGEGGYKAFVGECESGLLELFAPDRDILFDFNTRDANDIFGQRTDSEKNFGMQHHERPHNIRSLKCAINDFYRVYKILTENDFEYIDRWFYSFASYVIAYKADIAKDGTYGTIFSDKEVRILYPAYQDQYMFDAVKEWILHGIWNETALFHEIETIKERQKAEEPTEIVRMHRIMDVDEEVIHDGFPDVVNMAYAGTLTLDEYVLLLWNSCWARIYGLDLPISIDWVKVQAGVKICISKLIEIQADGQQLHSIITKENREYFSEDEWNTYLIIVEFKNENILMHSNNRKLYVEEMRKDAFSAFTVCQNKEYDIFDEEMAIATAEAFAKSNNSEKCQFPGYFDMMWKGNISSYAFKIDESFAGFCKLQYLLEEQKEKLQEANRAIAVHHTDEFIRRITDLIEKMEKKKRINNEDDVI